LERSTLIVQKGHLQRHGTCDMISATPESEQGASVPSPVNVEDGYPVTQMDPKNVARIFRVFPARPHAYTGKRHFYTEKHPGDYALGTERTFGREDSASVTDVDLDRMGPDPASAASLHVGATALAFHLDHTFFDEVAKTLALGVVQCMPSHPKHAAYIARTRQLRERIADTQKNELSRRPLPVVSVGSRNLPSFPAARSVVLEGWVASPTIELPPDELDSILTDQRARKVRPFATQASRIRCLRPYNQDERIALYRNVWGLYEAPPATALQPQSAVKSSLAPAADDIGSSGPSICATRVVYSQDDLATGERFTGGLGRLCHRRPTCGWITARVKVAAIWEYRVSACRCASPVGAEPNIG
jgi:hypothetical protein